MKSGNLSKLDDNNNIHTNKLQNIFLYLAKKIYICAKRKDMDNQLDIKQNPNNIAAEPAVAFGSMSYDAEYDTVLTVSNEKSRIKISIDKLSYLKYNWDGLEALPINNDVIKNINATVRISKNKDWKGWKIEPNVNGTIYLRRNDAAISLGNNAFSYYIKDGGKVVGKNKIAFSPESLIETIQMINLRIV